MTRNILTFTFAIVASALMATPSLQAQCSDCGPSIGRRIGSRLSARRASSIGTNAGSGVRDHDGMVLPTSDFVSPRTTIKSAVRDSFTPHRAYAYSNSGIDAANVHTWNQSEQNVYSWHGGYQNWRWGTPTALVVPPTASTMSSYAWGVGQTRSTPIYHQFGRGNAAMVGGGNGEQGFRWTPYWPQSTDQFGVYPVRGPW